MEINIIKKTGTANTTVCAKRIPKYLVIHYTAGTRSKNGQAKAIANMFSNPNTKASADFIVDDNDIVQYNPDPTTRYCWAVGGAKYSTLSTKEGAKYYGIAKNTNCISIEICSSKTNSKSLSVNDKDWYFSDAVIEKAIELSKYLMKLYNIDIDHVIMHHHVTGKICPLPFCQNDSCLTKWKDFKKQLTKTSSSTKDESASSTQNQSSSKSTYTGTFPTLPSCGYFKKGDSGSQVKNLQKLLNWINGDKITVDGSIGDKTISAIKKAQGILNATKDGVFGKNTLALAKKYKK